MLAREIVASVETVNSELKPRLRWLPCPLRVPE